MNGYRTSGTFPWPRRAAGGTCSIVPSTCEIGDGHLQADGQVAQSVAGGRTFEETPRMCALRDLVKTFQGSYSCCDGVGDVVATDTRNAMPGMRRRDRAFCRLLVMDGHHQSTRVESRWHRMGGCVLSLIPLFPALFCFFIFFF